MILYYFVNAKLKSHIQVYTVSAAGPAEVRLGELNPGAYLNGGAMVPWPPPSFGSPG